MPMGSAPRTARSFARREPADARVAVGREREPQGLGGDFAQAHHRAVVKGAAQGAVADHRVVLLHELSGVGEIQIVEDRLELVVQARHEKPVAVEKPALLQIPGRGLGPVRHRGIGHELDRHVDDEGAVLGHLDPGLFDDAADDFGVQIPFLVNCFERFKFLGLGDEQHALLRLRQKQLVGRHSALARRDLVEVDLEARARAVGHLERRRRETGGSHVLDTDDEARFHHFEAGFEQKFFGERIAHLNRRAIELAFGAPCTPSRPVLAPT
jgi:hypothetical protein